MKFSLFLKALLKLLFFIQYGESSNENEVTLNIINQLEIKQCVIVEDNSQDIETLKSIKYFADKNIYATSTNVRYFIIYTWGQQFNNARTAILIKINDMMEIFSRGPDADFFLNSFTWIIFDDSSKTFESKIKEYYIPFNCEFIIISTINDTYFQINDEYNIGFNVSTRRQRQNLGYWSDKKLMMTSESKEKRRLDMMGEEVVFLAPMQEVFFKNFSFPFKECPLFYGVCPFLKILLDISRSTNSTPIFRTVFGATSRELGAANAFADALQVDDINLAVKYWLGPISPLRGYFYIKNEIEEGFRTSAYLAPFTRHLWNQICIYLFASSITSSIIEYIKQNPTNKILSSFTAAFGPLESLCNQCGSNISQNFPSRLAWLAIQTTASILVPFYSAFIISYLTVYTPQLPFTNLETFIQDGTYKASGIKDTISHTLLVKSFEKFGNKANPNLILNGPPLMEKEAFELICTAKFKYAFVWYFDGYIKRHPMECGILKIPTPVFSRYTGIKLKAYSPHFEIYQTNFLRFFANGILDRMKKIQEKERTISDPEEDFIPISFKQIWLLINIIISGFVISAVLLALEMLLKRPKIGKRNNGGRILGDTEKPKFKTSCSWFFDLNISKVNRSLKNQLFERRARHPFDE